MNGPSASIFRPEPGSDKLTNSSHVPNSGRRPRHSWPRAMVAACAVSFGLISIIILWSAWSTGSFGAGLAYLRGDNVYAAPSIVTVPGDSSEGHSVQLTNLTGKPLRILGCNAACSCVHVSGLPLDLLPKQTKSVLVQASSATSKDVPVVYLTDRTDQPWVRTDVRVIAAGPTP